MKFAVIIFPGSNCDNDIIHVLKNVMQQEVISVWHKETSLPELSKEDCIMLPGGFSYGDYLRSGAIAKFSPIMKEVIDFANGGGKVWGICNGFQILCETGLLPGALLRNKEQRFICKNVYLKTTTTNSLITQGISQDKLLKIPIAHAEGRFYADDSTIKELNDKDQILFKYCDISGTVSKEANINGSRDSIAGICNENRNVFGMMPHPERAAESVLGNDDGKHLFESILGLVTA